MYTYIVSYVFSNPKSVCCTRPTICKVMCNRPIESFEDVKEIENALKVRHDGCKDIHLISWSPNPV